MVSPVRVRVPPLLFSKDLQVKLSVILIRCQMHYLVSPKVFCVLEGSKPLEGSSDIPGSIDAPESTDAPGSIDIPGAQRRMGESYGGSQGGNTGVRLE